MKMPLLLVPTIFLMGCSGASTNVNVNVQSNANATGHVLSNAVNMAKQLQKDQSANLNQRLEQFNTNQNVNR